MVDLFFSDILVPFALAITMLGMGLSLEKRDFSIVFRYSKALITGVLNKLIILPLIAFAICLFTDIDIEYKIGLILIAACPGGATTNLLTYLLRGNLALSISMTAMNSLISLISIPFIINISLLYFYGISQEISLPVLNTILSIFLLTIIPTMIGIYLRAHKTDLAIKLEKPLRYILPSILLIVFAGVLYSEQQSSDSAFESSLILFKFKSPLYLLYLVSSKIGVK